MDLYFVVEDNIRRRVSDSLLNNLHLHFWRRKPNSIPQ